MEWEIGARPYGEGWDNVMWPVGSYDGQRCVLRVARRSSARELLDREVTVLRLLAATTLPMSVPRPLARSAEAVLLPWMPGPTAAEVDAETRLRVGDDLARTLAAVHALPPPVIERNRVRGVPLAARAESLARDLDRMRLDAAARRHALDWWERGMAAPVWGGADVLVHGDPHPGNVIIPDETTGQQGDRRAAVLIDWGDVTVGDPASDLGALLLHGHPEELLATYCAHAPITGEDWAALADRAWAWGARMALLLLSAYPDDHPLGRVGRGFLTP